MKKKLLKLTDECTPPNLEGPLCPTIPSSSIEMENKEVRPIVQGEGTTGSVAFIKSILLVKRLMLPNMLQSSASPFNSVLC